MCTSAFFVDIFNTKKQGKYSGQLARVKFHTPFLVVTRTGIFTVQVYIKPNKESVPYHHPTSGRLSRDGAGKNSKW